MIKILLFDPQFDPQSKILRILEGLKRKCKKILISSKDHKNPQISSFRNNPLKNSKYFGD